MSFCSDISEADYNRLKHITNTYGIVMDSGQLVIWIVGLSLIFIKNRKNRKPGFIKTIWVVVFLNVICKVGYTYYSYTYNFKETSNFDVAVLDICTFTSATLQTIAHWIFSIEYFELSIKFEMILGHVKQDIEAQFKRKNSQVLIANLIFYIWTAIQYTGWITYFLISGNGELFYLIQEVGNLYVATVLIYSMFRLENQFKKMSQNEL